jgi:ADP-L-glycero-D-manno-heptose 6-epimerase
VEPGKPDHLNDIAKTLIKLHGSGKLSYIPFPDHLKGAYQSFTQANINKLRNIGYDQEFTTLEEGVRKYYEWYQENKPWLIGA